MTIFLTIVWVVVAEALVVVDLRDDVEASPVDLRRVTVFLVVFLVVEVVALESALAAVVFFVLLAALVSWSCLSWIPFAVVGVADVRGFCCCFLSFSSWVRRWSSCCRCCCKRCCCCCCCCWSCRCRICCLACWAALPLLGRAIPAWRFFCSMKWVR